MGVVRLPVLVGPTAAGKTAAALQLAAAHPVTVIVADSRQVYRGFDVGTAKPTTAERARVPHAALDLADPTERWNASRWATFATDAVAAARGEGRIPLVVGGTGLYVRSLFEPLFEEPPLDPGRRAILADELEGLPVAELRRRVERVDPARAHLGRTQLLRALEVERLTGRPLSEWHRAAARETSFVPSYLVLERGPALGTRIEARVDAMLRDGWLAEVAQLVTTVPSGAPAWNATGYAAIREVVEGRRDLVSAREEVIIRTRQYAKRQRTWFRHQLPPALTTTIDLEGRDADRQLDAWWRTFLEHS